MRRGDPRIRQTLNHISQNIESANLTTQASLFSFSQAYISPCLSSFKTCLEASCQPCCAALSHEDNRHRPHHRQRHQQQRARREDLAFDFYDDWEQDEAEWGNDELDRLLSGDGDVIGQQPRRQGTMSYGTLGLVRRGKSGLDDHNVVPKSSMFGFLERLPWKIGGRGVRYRPSVADLQENVGKRGAEIEPLISEEEGQSRGRHGRSRSDTVGSRSTANSLSSRGDLLPSEDEDDAVPLDDEFAMALERRNTGTMSDDHSSGIKGQKRPSGSRASTKTASSRGTKKGRRGTSASRGKRLDIDETTEDDSVVDLKQEEERARREEEAAVEERRRVAQRLALERGLSNPEHRGSEVSFDYS